MLRVEFPRSPSCLIQELVLLLSQWQEHLQSRHSLCFCSPLSPVSRGSGGQWEQIAEDKGEVGVQSASQGFPKPSTLIFGTCSCFS